MAGTPLPILIAARDEEILLPRALTSMARAIETFRGRVAGVDPVLVVCDNGSRDATPEILQRFQSELAIRGVRLEIESEPEAGKERAVWRLLDAVGRNHAAASRLVFADADVEWEPDALVALWAYLDEHPAVNVVGANIIPRDDSPWTVWSVADTVPYADYGLGELGLGRHMRFAIGMTYMARTPLIETLHRRLSPNLIDEDLAINVLSKPGTVAVAESARIRFQAARTLRELWAYRFRHIRGIVQLKRWLSGQDGHTPRTAGRAVDRVVDIDTVSLARSLVFGRHRVAARENGATVLKYGVPAFLSWTHFGAVFGVMLPTYAVMKGLARIQSRLGIEPSSWRPHRVG